MLTILRSFYTIDKSDHTNPILIIAITYSVYAIYWSDFTIAILITTFVLSE